MRLFAHLWLAIACITGLSGGYVAGTLPARAQDEVLVFAAASLTDALLEAAVAFEAETDSEITISFAGSSVLARQIEAGAPAAIYFSANTAWMDYLAERAFIDIDSRVDLLGNDLVVIAPASGDTRLDDPDDLPGLLGDGRLAIADPDHVPAGIYARESLTHLGLWEALAPRTARTADVRGALALVARGEVPAGIVYRTDAAIVDDVRVIHALPPDSHTPIVYPAALTPQAGDAARAFLDFLETPAAAAIFVRYGFSVMDGGAADPS